MLTAHCQVVSVDPVSRLITVRGPKGGEVRLEVRDPKKLEGIKAGDRFLVRYIEAVHIRKGRADESIPAVSLKAGVLQAQPGHLSGGLARKQTLVAIVEAIDESDQEVTLRGPDGSLETVMVDNPESLKSIKSGDRIVITNSQALVLSLEKET
jgi:hypothetical protein